MPRHDAEAASALPADGMVGVQVDGRQIVVGRAGGTLFAFLDRCPHAGAPLSRGRLDGATVTCQRHGWAFDVLTGQSVPDPSAFCLAKRPVSLEGGRVWVDLP